VTQKDIPPTPLSKGGLREEAVPGEKVPPIKTAPPFLTGDL